MGYFGFLEGFCFHVEICPACRIILLGMFFLCFLLFHFFSIFSVTHFSFLCFLGLFYLPVQNLLCLARDGGVKFVLAGTCSGSEHSEINVTTVICRTENALEW